MWGPAFPTIQNTETEQHISVGAKQLTIWGQGFNSESTVQFLGTSATPSIVSYDFSKIVLEESGGWSYPAGTIIWAKVRLNEAFY